jgi:CRP-like cAMP-binding protein
MSHAIASPGAPHATVARLHDRDRPHALALRRVDEGTRKGIASDLHGSWRKTRDEDSAPPQFPSRVIRGEYCNSAMADARQNYLLRALSQSHLERLLPLLERVEMPFGDVLHESGSVMHHVYFPTTSIVSLLCVTTDGATTEIGVVGNEGMVGIALFMGGETTPSRALVQSAGFAYRLKSQYLRNELAGAPALQQSLLLYTQALLTQMAQTAVCNRHHSVLEQLCRRLLLSLDRLSSNRLNMTQEQIATMLGVRREGVTTAGGPNIVPSGYLMLVDGELQIRGVYDSNDDGAMKILPLDVRALARR